LKSLTIIFAVVMLAGAGYAPAQQRVIVRLESRSIPQPLRQFAPRAAIADALIQGKSADALQSSSQRVLIERLSRYVVLDLPSGKDLSALVGTDGVEDVRPLSRFRLHEQPLTDDSLSDRQYALNRVGAARAWQRATGKGTVVGIIDTGIDWTHEDLAGALSITPSEDHNGNRRFDAWSHRDTIGGLTGDLDGLDNDGNGIVDDVIGIDLVDQATRNLGDDREYDPIPFDEQGHGTLVGGVIAATPNNRRGIAGLAYDARLRIVRAFDATGNAEEDDIAAGIVYLALQGVDVINMSFGDGVDSPLMRDAIRFAHERGCLLVASAGNTGTTSRQFPAGYDNVIVVAATNDENQRSPFSSSGPLVALSAPGQAIVTTSVGSRYRTVNGTSFSAPYVAATIAMMRERFPSMDRAEVRATLQQRTLDLGPRGWDDLFGAGLLQADLALADGPPSRLEITDPSNEIEIDPSQAPQIDVRGSSMLASFSGYELAWAEGLSPRTWSTVATSSKAVRDGLLGRISLPASDSQVVTLRLRVLSSDGRSLDVFRRVRLVPSADLSIRSIEIVPAWKTDRRTAVVTVRTTLPCACELTSTTDTTALVQSLRRARVHSMIVPDTLRSVAEQQLLVRCTSEVGSQHDSTIVINGSMQGAGADSQWSSAGAAPWSGYVLNDIRDIYRDGRATVVMNDMSRGTFGALVTRQYADGRWNTRDSIPDVYIPRGLGDANGNGLLDLLVHTVGKMVLFEQREPGGSPFASVIFADTTSGVNGAGMVDIDGDGREELIGLADDECLVYTFKGAAFRLLGSITNSTPPAPGNAINRVDEISIASGDFDGDGRMEIAFSDTDGDLVIGEWQGARFDLTYTLTQPGAGGSGFVAQGDVTGDGRPDVVYGVPDSIEADANGDYGRSVWTYTLLGSTADNTFEQLWQDRVAGVRNGAGFRNGLAVGDLDDVKGAEIVLCAFPRLYVFGRNARDTSLVCKRYIADVASPRFLIHDIDRNGRRELGYGVTIAEIGAMTSFVFTETLVYELEAPSSLRAQWLGDDLQLDWMRSSSDKLSVIEWAEPSAPFTLLDTTNGMSFTLAASSFTAPVMRFRVRTLDASAGTLSSPSNLVTVFVRGSSPRLVSSRDTVRRSEVQAGLMMPMIATADLDMRSLTTTMFEYIDDAGRKVGRARSVVPRSLRDIVVSFPPHEPGSSVGIAMRGIRDAQGRGLADSVIIVQVVPDVPTAREITLASVTVESLRQLRVSFSEPVDQSAEQVTAYRLAPAGRIVSVVRTDESTLQLFLDGEKPLEPRGVPYSITATEVTSASGARMTNSAGSTLLFTVVAPDLESVYAYPQPLRLGQHAALTIGGLPSAATVEVLDASFAPLRRLETTSGVGGIEWDLRLSDGRTLVPGLYYVRVSDESNPDAGPVLRKVWIER
jgi:subtilisin family serine protease